MSRKNNFSQNIKKRPRFLFFIISFGLLCLASIVFMHVYPLPKNTSVFFGPTFGEKDAPLTLQIFEDIQCASCRKYNADFFTFIKKNYLSTQKASYQVVFLAFIPKSLEKTNAALCLIQQDTHVFENYVKALSLKKYFLYNIKNRESWVKKQPSINITAWKKCVKNKTYFPLIQKNLLLAKKIMPEISTPRLRANKTWIPLSTTQTLRQTLNHLLSLYYEKRKT